MLIVCVVLMQPILTVECVLLDFNLLCLESQVFVILQHIQYLQCHHVMILARLVPVPSVINASHAALLTFYHSLQEVVLAFTLVRN